MGKYQQAKRLLIFQLKLGADALRDLLLSPVAVVCVIIDMVKGHNDEHSNFQKLMRLGRKTDSLINLFEHKQAQDEVSEQEMDIDQLADKIEAAVKREYQEQHFAKKVKIALRNKLANSNPNEPPKQ